jgi:adenine-specific DNA-methyltransferase
MILKQLSLKQSLNDAYRLIKPERADIEKFKSNFKLLLSHINPKESEENMKGHVMDFLKNTYYNPDYHIATKGRTDFVIHTDKDATHPAGVLFEVKKPSNPEMVTISNLNVKAMHEISLYYLRERIDHHNNDIKYVVITNIYEWFVFDAPVFERMFFKNNALVKEYKAWMAKQKVSANNDLFYNEIAKPFLASLTEEIEFTWFDIRAFEKSLLDSDKKNDNKLIPLFKVLSPTHLLKLPFANDSNSLNKGFYSELLYLIGLEEVKEGSKKLIRRKQQGKRNYGSLLENAIIILETENCLHKLSDLQSYGETKDEQLFSVALELCITWINRILFLKLLEAQLLKYHKDNSDYRFLNYKIIPQYDELYKLFFQVLAKKNEERITKVKEKYSHIPYLNSSLFEITQLEEQTIRINMLDDSAEMPLLNNTVLKDEHNKPIAEKLNTLQYIFEFLYAYDFASEGSEEIQEERKTLINASVLGLIFEKINGYKDGSIFTPGFITMYMCRQSIRQAVLNKFKEKYNWKADAFEDLHNYIADDRSNKSIKQYNALINSLTICDIAVGSGHFLVSVLNELIAIKSELGILADENGKRLSDYTAKVENDELIITDKEGNFFTYYITTTNGKLSIPNEEMQRVQITLFHEKQTIIENCLFGVDINPKSVQICRLRLWIELLKNAYYIADGSNSNGELQTLPNIDINIKTGNSHISRFALDEDLKAATPYFEKKILEFKSWVADYKHEVDREKKGGIQQLIADLKKGFLSKITDRNPTKIKVNKLTNEFLNKYVNEKLFSQNLTAEQKKDKERIEKDIEKLNKELEAYVKSPIYHNAFEWRFEFPEVLDSEGNFIGFDVVIGNPPYGVEFNYQLKDYFKRTFNSNNGELEIYAFFIEMSLNGLIKPQGILSFITSNTWYYLDKFSTLRCGILNAWDINYLIELEKNVFADAPDIVPAITQIQKFNTNRKINTYKAVVTKKVYDLALFNDFISNSISKDDYREKPNCVFNLLLDEKTKNLSKKISSHPLLSENYKTVYGIKTGDNKLNLSKKILAEGNWKKSVSTANNIKKYIIDWKGDYLNVGKHLPGLGNTNYEQPKILIQYIRKLSMHVRLVCAFDAEGSFYPLNNYSFIISKNANSLKYLIGILNSKLMNWYFANTFIDYNIKPKYIEQLPIIIESSALWQMEDLVRKIIDTKQKDISADTTQLENQIDQLVYKLYNLTPEEIKIIEASTK